MNGGIILINKEKGLSSQKVDSIIKRSLPFKKVGHLGTLDPLAEGLLVILIDDGTKYAKYFEDSRKKYLLEVRLGATSISLDDEAPLIDIKDFNYTGKEECLDKILSSFVTKYLQTPPLYSAIKVNGDPLYKYAVRNKEVEIKPRPVEVYNIKRTTPITYKDSFSYFSLEVESSKGFYVRSLAKEIGDKIGISSMASYIRRLEVGPFKLDDALTLVDLTNNKYSFIDPYNYLNFKVKTIDDLLVKDVLNGVRLSNKILGNEQYYKVETKDHVPLAIYKLNEENKYYEMDLLVKR